MVVYTWNTKKVGNEFLYTILQMIPRKTPNKKGLYITQKILRQGILKSRARSVAQAKRWIRSYKLEGRYK